MRYFKSTVFKGVLKASSRLIGGRDAEAGGGGWGGCHALEGGVSRSGRGVLVFADELECHD
jgi:hypothetical protein